MSNIDELANDVIRDFRQREGCRGVWEEYWDQIAELVAPNMRGNFRQGDYITPGERRTDRQMDSRPTIALGRFKAILDSLLTPRNQTWHRLVPTNPDLLKSHRVQLYFDELTRKLFRFRYAPTANFSSQNQQVYEGLGAFGSSSMYVDKLQGANGFRYRAVNVGETYWRQNHQGIVDDIIRVFKLPASALVQNEEWRDELPEKVFKDAAHSPNTEYEILHRVRPRMDHDPEALDERAMPFESVYVLKTAGPKVLSTGGYNSFPYAPTRYDQAPTEVYGRSPAMQSFSAIKSLNVLKRVVLTQGHRAINPVLLVHDDGLMDNVNLRPGSAIGGGISADGRRLVDVLPAGDYAQGLDMMREEEEEINSAFLVELFQILVETPRMTATEVLERTREKGILLAPTVGRQESEYLGPLIQREIDLLAQMGELPEFPPELKEAEGEYDIAYDNPLSRTARAEEAVGFNRMLDVLLPLVGQTGDPSVFDNFNTDEITRQMAHIQAVPPGWMRSPEEVAAMRQQRAEAQRLAQAEQQTPQMLSAIASAKKAGVTEEDLA